MSLGHRGGGAVSVRELPVSAVVVPGGVSVVGVEGGWGVVGVEPVPTWVSWVSLTVDEPHEATQKRSRVGRSMDPG